MSRILLKNGKVWNGEEFFHSDILTENNVIIKIEERITEKSDYIYDATNKIVAPGLVDAHIHIEGISSDKYGINAEMCTIPFGVTAAADASGVKGNKNLLDSFLIKNRVFVYTEFIDCKPNLSKVLNMMKKYKNRVVGLKISTEDIAFKDNNISPLNEITKFVKAHNLIIMVHSSNSLITMPKLLSSLNKGDIITHAYHGGNNNVSNDEFQCIKIAKEKGIIIDAGLAGHIHTDFKIFKEAIYSGAIPDIISTDITKLSAYKRGGKYGLPMCMSIARYLGMNETDIFKAVTSNPAKAIKIENISGKLDVGRIADISILEYCNDGFNLTDNAGNHIESKKGYRNVLTVANGEIVYKN